ncbi:hypothetical protein [Nocardioides kribbensis]|uniref:hypothetical protein n=1 Tax=Nocardioides kribbensis TaxID=305517 RepID=UPI00187A159D|nr:hypothetical protein [Nocardioides kribbensis]
MKTAPNKAIAAFVLTLLATLLASIQGRKEFSELTVLEWLIVVGSAVVTTAGVYVTSNPPVGEHRAVD